MCLTYFMIIESTTYGKYVDFDAVARAWMPNCLDILLDSQLLFQTDKVSPIGPVPFVPLLLDILAILHYFT